MDNENLSYLHRAVRTSDARAVNTLLDNGADINRKDKDGFTPLHAAVRYVLASEVGGAGCGSMSLIHGVCSAHFALPKTLYLPPFVCQSWLVN